ncbi:type I-E CRISPR-associated protein Cse2/CasB [Streptomyces sp. NPDC056056]|uniref:type I-E CRISPR-associated protein Cse2/CasB n=1 Tax=Streptomyces sp. NPDC056056 TaxID=3345698 RepID=UPI0035E07E6B
MSGGEITDDFSRRVETTTHDILARLQGLLAHGRGRDVKARLSRHMPPDDPELWLALDLAGLYPVVGPAPSEVTQTRAASAVTAAAQLWAMSDLPHRTTTAQRPTSIGAVLAQVIAARRADAADVARLLRSHTLGEALPHLRPLLIHARRQSLALDFGLLARDLYTWQVPGGPHRVGQIWAHTLANTQARAAHAARSRTASTTS